MVRKGGRLSACVRMANLYQFEKRMRQIHTPKPSLYVAFLILNFELLLPSRFVKSLISANLAT